MRSISAWDFCAAVGGSRASMCACVRTRIGERDKRRTRRGGEEANARRQFPILIDLGIDRALIRALVRGRHYRDAIGSAISRSIKLSIENERARVSQRGNAGGKKRGKKKEKKTAAIK
jgi:hypothetical protein